MLGFCHYLVVVLTFNDAIDMRYSSTRRRRIVRMRQYFTMYIMCIYFFNSWSVYFFCFVFFLSVSFGVLVCLSPLWLRKTVLPSVSG